MATNQIPKASLDINSRFFMAIDHLVSSRKIRGLGTLSKLWDVSRFALSWSRNHPEEKPIKVEYLYYIARDFDVSLEWLFFGKGEMFKS